MPAPNETKSATVNTKQAIRELPTDEQMKDLKETALAIYIDLVPKMRGLDESRAAAKAFAWAKKFVDEAERIAAGGAIEEATVRPLGNPVISVHQFDYEKNKPAFDEYNRPIFVTQNGDPCAHAPNLPPEHVINQRFWRALQVLQLEVPPAYANAAKNAATPSLSN